MRANPGQSAPIMKCLQCGHSGKTRKMSYVSGRAVFILLCSGFIPGILYWLIVRKFDKWVCDNCESGNVIPTK